MTKLMKKYTELLENNTLTESNLISLKSRIGWNSCSLTEEEVGELKNRLAYLECEYSITEEHAERGMEYLLRKCFKKNGQRRRTTQLVNMPVAFFEAIKEYSHFTFVGFEEVDFNIYNDKSFYMPVWRIHTNSGETFDYYMDTGLVFNHTGENTITPRLKLIA